MMGQYPQLELKYAKLSKCAKNDKKMSNTMFLDVESHVGKIEHTAPSISTQTLRL